MRPDHSAPTRVPSLRSARGRLALWWAGFGLATVATIFAVHRLYETVRRELHEQGELALAQQQAKVRERVQAHTDAIRRSTLKALAGFHVEGLGYAMRRWDEATPGVIGTFQWDAEQQFLPGSTLLEGRAKPDEIAELWREFRARKPTESNGSGGEPSSTGAFRTAVFRMLGNPDFPPAELGYQGENLEILSYAGRPVDPWAGWAVHRHEPGAPWIFWYQPGPGAAVRGCFVDVAPIVAQLRGELTDHRLARVEIVEERTPAARSEGGELGSLVRWLPGYALVASHGELFTEKQGAARISALAVVLLLGLFLIGAIFLAMFSRREVSDAERKTTFVTQVSHELRTPLTSIRMFADMLAADDLPVEKRTKFAGTISRESQRLSALIERLLAFHALEKGKHAVTIEPVDVAAVVRETLEEMEATLHASGMRAEPELPSGPVLAATDRSTLKQALLNLLDNALKYAREGKVVRITFPPVTDRVRLRVADQGPGIARSLGPRVFEPFVQGGQTLTDKSPGVGLGLSIARGLLRNAGGDLVLLPSEHGALFEIHLPHASLS